MVDIFKIVLILFFPCVFLWGHPGKDMDIQGYPKFEFKETVYPATYKIGDSRLFISVDTLANSNYRLYFHNTPDFTASNSIVLRYTYNNNNSSDLSIIYNSSAPKEIVFIERYKLVSEMKMPSYIVVDSIYRKGSLQEMRVKIPYKEWFNNIENEHGGIVIEPNVYMNGFHYFDGTDYYAKQAELINQ